MNVLLIGKFPPCQGGVSSKYYWMYQALTRHFDFSWHAITILKKPYCSTALPTNPANISVLEDVDHELPWFIPKTDLIVDRLVNMGLQISNVKKFDLIEVNYLQPFASAGWILSTLLRLPLLIRPAGSDYHKFLSYPGVKLSMEAYLTHCSKILLPPEKIVDFHLRFPKIPEEKIIPIRRYVPDTEFFQPHFINDSPAAGVKKILFLGKINQFWSLRKIEILFGFLKNNHEYKLRCIIDGSHCEQFIRFIESNINSSQLEIINGFVPPTDIPQEMQSASAVWNYLAPGGIIDFPNPHWEAIASGRYSIVSDFLLSLPDLKVEAPYSELIINADVLGSLEKIKTQCKESVITKAKNSLTLHHTEYLREAMSIYTETAK